MENMFVGVIFLSAYFLAVSTASVVPEQVGCKEGESSAGKFIVGKINLSHEI
jgi:hypothetical protein